MLLLLRQLLLLPVLLPALVMAAPLVAAVLVHSSQVLSPVLQPASDSTCVSGAALQPYLQGALTSVHHHQRPCTNVIRHP